MSDDRAHARTPWPEGLDRADAFEQAFATSPSGLAICDAGGVMFAANRALAAFLDLPDAGALVGGNLQDHLLRTDRRAVPAASDRAFQLAGGEIRWGRLRQSPLGPSGLLTLVHVDDVTEARASQAKLEYDAGHDHLTGLVNRRTFMDALQDALHDETTGTALLVVDVDRFKSINDALGHPEGDRLLETLAARLRATMRADDVVCRLGGDEFAVLLRSPVTVEEAASTAERVVALASQPVELDGQPVGTSVSVGVSFSVPGVTLERLLSEADTALYRAKNEGRNRCVVFDDELRAAVDRRSRLEGELRVALSAERLELHYQPEVDLRTGAVLGVEALIRWNHPIHGMLAADEFVGIAEDAGIVTELGRWVLHTACRTLAELRDRPDLTMRVNVSAVQLERPDLVAEVASALAESAIRPARLCLEITETAVMTDVTRSMEVLHQLAALGVELAIDDFGTGFSSLAYLKRLPVAALKIDKSFVEDVATDPDGRAIVDSVLLLASSLELGVIAEGVERDDQRSVLVELGCTRAQGHLFAAAMDQDSLSAWLRDRANNVAGQYS